MYDHFLKKKSWKDKENVFQAKANSQKICSKILWQNLQIVQYRMKSEVTDRSWGAQLLL